MALGVDLCILYLKVTEGKVSLSTWYIRNLDNNSFFVYFDGHHNTTFNTKPHSSQNHIQHKTTSKPHSSQNHIHHKTTFSTKPHSTQNHIHHKTTFITKRHSTHIHHKTTFNTKPLSTQNHIPHSSQNHIQHKTTFNTNHIHHKTTFDTKPHSSRNHLQLAVRDSTDQVFSFFSGNPFSGCIGLSVPNFKLVEHTLQMFCAEQI